MSEFLTLSSIKAMDECHRKKLCADELLTVILASAEEKTDMWNNLNTSIVNLNDTIKSFRKEVENNLMQIVSLTSKILLLEEENKQIKTDIEDSQRRSRINNIEVIGLPNPNGTLMDEAMTLDVLNNSLGLNHASIDIEACHVVPSKQKDGKRVTVCRFLSHKVKDSVFAAKKGKRDIKYSGNNIYILMSNLLLVHGRFSIWQVRKKGN